MRTLRKSSCRRGVFFFGISGFGVGSSAFVRLDYGSFSGTLQGGGVASRGGFVGVLPEDYCKEDPCNFPWDGELAKN